MMDMLTWSRILMLEGLVTVLVGVACFFFLPNSPATAAFLKPEERAFLIERLRSDNGGASGKVDTNEQFQWKYMKDALTDWKIYISVLIYWGNAISTYGYDKFITSGVFVPCWPPYVPILIETIDLSTPYLPSLRNWATVRPTHNY